MKSKLIAIFVFLQLAAWCAAASFPLCMYGVNRTQDLKTIKDAGFNCFQTYKQDPKLMSALAKEAQKQNLQIVFYPQPLLKAGNEEMLKAAQNWPVLAWYIYDEPDVASAAPIAIAALNAKVKAALPSHQTALVIGQGKTKNNYYALADILMVDWYPVPHLPLISFGEQVALARQGLKKNKAQNKPLWAVLQIFDWKEYKQYRPDDDRIGRFPTETEIRFMAYDAIFNGANGLFYFIFTSNGLPLPKAKPQNWAEIKDINLELSKISPFFSDGKRIKNPVRLSSPLKAMTWQLEGTA
ncbi:MAG: hypothetical protein LBM71_01335, partial [Elusimicrobiota bacterium]|nr:hypothetical protein [Elusimicrobiota bacterium]